MVRVPDLTAEMCMSELPSRFVVGMASLSG